MTRHVVCVRPDTTIDQAVAIMLDRHFSGLPVVDEKGTLVGIVSEGDLLRRSELGTERKRSRWLQFLLSPGRLAADYAHARGRRVEEVMTHDLHTVSGTDTLETVVELMARHGVKRIPIVQHGGLIGLVTRADVLRALAKELNQAKPTIVMGDAELAAAIRRAFEQSGCIPTALIDVSVRDGVVELQGSITDERERTAAKVAVENVPGVKAIHDHLMWVEPMSGMVILSPEDEAAERSKKAQAA